MQNQEKETVDLAMAKGEAEETPTNEVAEEAQTASECEPSELVPPRTEEVIEVEWSQVEQLYKVNTYSKQLSTQLAELCIRYEKTKQNLLSRISECDTFLFNSGTTLKDSCGIDSNLTYELKLPNLEGEKAFFLRKDA